MEGIGCIERVVGIQDEHTVEVEQRKVVVLAVGCMNTAGLEDHIDDFVGMEEHTGLAHLAGGMAEAAGLYLGIADKGLARGSSPCKHYQKIS